MDKKNNSQLTHLLHLKLYNSVLCDAGATLFQQDYTIKLEHMFYSTLVTLNAHLLLNEPTDDMHCFG